MSSFTFRATVNGSPVHLKVHPLKSLLEVLREDLRLTGAKKSCNTGVCGACTVIVDGKALLSCIKSVRDVNGSRIETIEGLEKNGSLHPIQQAFIKAHGFQCGICTPGMIMSVKALLDRHPHPTHKRILSALKKNLCRCTGYQQVIEAVKLAAGEINERKPGYNKFFTISCGKEESFRVIGRSHPDVNGVLKVTGKGKYAADIKLPGMLFGKTVRSEYTHARILQIDISEAERVPGVVKILTWKDIPGENRYGKNIRDQQVFAKERVRCIGEPIALVVAESRRAANTAAGMVSVKYHPLPAVYDPCEAMDPDAPQIHEAGNILYHYHLEKGDVERGFEESDLVVENEYRTQPQEHALLEPEAAVAYLGDDGKLVVLGQGQSVFFDRLNIIRALGVPRNDVRVIQPLIGGAFGKREDIYPQIHAALAAFVTGKPVKIEYTREESFLVTTKRTRQITVIKMGVMRSGEIVALQATIVGDSGAYASWSENIMRKAGVLVSGPYRIPNVKVDSYAVYTNNPMSGATRGFGATETAFCSESHMDMVASQLRMDPLEFRLKNILKQNSTTSTGMRLMDYVPAEDTIKEAAKRFRWKERRSDSNNGNGDIRRGAGMATTWYGIGFGVGIPDTTRCIAELEKDGSLTLYVGTVDYGNSSNTTFTMLASEVLGISTEKIRVINADSELTPNCGSTVATKQTFTTGNAVVRACQMIREDIIRIAGELLGIESGRIELNSGWAVCRDEPSKKLSLEKIAGRFEEFGRPRRREGLFKAHKLTEPLDAVKGTGKAWYPLSYGTQMAEVEVNIKTGEVKVIKITAAHYVGRVLNPASLRGQILGGISFGWGYALREDAGYKDGIPRNLNFDQYRIMRITDLPEIEVIAIERDERSGPFGAIGVGEPPTLPTAPAVANAVYDAVGVRIFELLITPERVLKGLKELNLDKRTYAS